MAARTMRPTLHRPLCCPQQGLLLLAVAALLVAAARAVPLPRALHLEGGGEPAEPLSFMHNMGGASAAKPRTGDIPYIRCQARPGSGRGLGIAVLQSEGVRRNAYPSGRLQVCELLATQAWKQGKQLLKQGTPDNPVRVLGGSVALLPALLRWQCCRMPPAGDGPDATLTCSSLLASSVGMGVQVHEDRMIELVEQLTSGRHSPWVTSLPPWLPARLPSGSASELLSVPTSSLSGHPRRMQRLRSLLKPISPFCRPAADRPEGKWLCQLELVPQGERLAVQEKEQVGWGGSGRNLR